MGKPQITEFCSPSETEVDHLGLINHETELWSWKKERMDVHGHNWWKQDHSQTIASLHSKEQKHI